MKHGEPTYVQFVDYGLVPRPRLRPPTPGESWINHAAFRDDGRAVALVEALIAGPVPHFIAKQHVVPSELTDKRLGVWIDQQLMVVKAVASSRLVRPVDAVAIDSTRPNVGEIAAPDLVRALREYEASCLHLPSAIKDAEFHLLGMGCK